MKKLSLVLCTLALLLLTGCSSAQKNLDNLKQELAEIRQPGATEQGKIL